MWNERPFYDFLVSEDTTPMVEFIESDNNEPTNDSNYSSPDLVDASDSEDEPEQVDDQESFQEVDSNVYLSLIHI